MKKLLYSTAIAALALTAIMPAPAAAQNFLPGLNVTDSNPQPVKLQCWNGSAFAACSLSGGSGGGGGAVTAASGAFVAGSIVDLSSGGLIDTDLKALLKAGQTINTKLLDASGAAFGTSANPIYVSGGSGGGSTPTGAAGTPNAAVVTIQGISGGTVVPVSGAFYQATQPVSLATIPLASGAATAAKQPALGTAGTASADVITVQGIAGGVAQPISGTVTASISNFPATQPVSGSVSVSNFPASQAVTNAGTFAVQASSAQLPASLGAKTSAGSVSFVIATDGPGSSAGTPIYTSSTGGSSGTVAQGSTTSGQAGMLNQGAVTTAAPAYTSGQTSPVSLTPVGNLRVDGSSVTQPVTGTVTAGAGSAIIGRVGVDQTTPGTTNGVAVKGVNPAAAQIQLATDTGGRLLPGQGIATSVQVTTTASTATQALAASTTRLAFEGSVETALTAPLYLCLNGQTTCSATVHDVMIASGAGAGTRYTAPFGFQGAIYYYTTQASVILNLTSWAAQ